MNQSGGDDDFEKILSEQDLIDRGRQYSKIVGQMEKQEDFNNQVSHTLGEKIKDLDQKFQAKQKEFLMLENQYKSLNYNLTTLNKGLSNFIYKKDPEEKKETQSLLQEINKNFQVLMNMQNQGGNLQEQNNKLLGENLNLKSEIKHIQNQKQDSIDKQKKSKVEQELMQKLESLQIQLQEEKNKYISNTSSKQEFDKLYQDNQKLYQEKTSLQQQIELLQKEKNTNVNGTQKTQEQFKQLEQEKNKLQYQVKENESLMFIQSQSNEELQKVINSLKNENETQKFILESYDMEQYFQKITSKIISEKPNIEQIELKEKMINEVKIVIKGCNQMLGRYSTNITFEVNR